MITLNERAGFELEARFTAYDGTYTLPSTVHWRLDCETTNTVLQDWTLAVVTSEYDLVGNLSNAMVAIEVDGSLNAIRASRNKRELKRLLVVADKDTAREYSDEFSYYIRNLQGR